MPYWEYLFLNGKINKSDKDDLEEGALLLLYLYFKELYEAEGTGFIYTRHLFYTIEKTIALYEPDSHRKEQMAERIKFAQLHYSNERLGDQNSSQLNVEEIGLRNSLIDNDTWVYNEFVAKYYIDRVSFFKQS